MKRIIIVLTGVLIATTVFSQNRVVHGKITVFNTYPVQNVEVTAKKAKTSITTDSLGQFAIVCLEKDVIMIKPKTFRSTNRRVGPDTDSLMINLLFIDSKSNRKQAVGYGYISEEDLTYAVSNLQQENNDYCNYTDIFDLIRAKFSGVTISNGQVILAGSGSFSGQVEALFILNGIAVNSIDWIQPCQIKSISVLKGSNAAIYGTRAGNGVILIETRNK